MFLDTSRGSFSVCLRVSDCASVCLCTWSMWEPTPYTLQMSSCLIINPTFHAYVNFIITDTCIHSEGLHTFMHVHMHTHTHTYTTTRAPPPSKLPQFEEQLHQRQLSLISLYIRHLFLAYSFFASVTSHILFPLSFAHSPVLLSLCFLPGLFLTFCFSLCSSYLPERFSSKEK